MTTYTGKTVDPFNLRLEDLDIRDIAHALALMNRFVGATREPYSVAQHSCLVASLLPPQDALAGLLHDSGEAYLGDVATPTKAHECMGGYREAEARVMERVGVWTGVRDWGVVWDVDHKLCATEAWCLYRTPPQWAIDRERYAIRVAAWGWREAEDAFLADWYRLTAKLAFKAA